MASKRTWRFRRRLRDLSDLLGFLRRRRSVFLAALVSLLLLVALVLYLIQSATVAPYIYPLF